MATPLDLAWGAGPSGSYDDLAGRFRPVFDRIRDGTVERERTRRLPFEEIRALKDSGFTAVRLPRDDGGSGASLPDLFNLLIELAHADSNLAQALRVHFGFVEEVLCTPDAAKRSRWMPRLARGETAGSARSELGNALTAFDTTVRRDGAGWRLNGRKFYTTGSLYADWVHVAANCEEDGASVTAVVPRDAPGVTVIDDWDGFGQILTASGTSTFEDVAVPPDDLVPDAELFPYVVPFYQMVHLATLAGVGRAAADDAARAVAVRKRTYSHAAASLSSRDPQVLQVIGRVRGAAYAAGAIVSKASEALERVYGDVRAGRDIRGPLAVAELESAQSQTVVSSLILDATTVLFDALGASATLKGHALDRHWRNARTLTSHNPRIYKERIVGDFAVNGTEPPQRWRVGEA